MTRVELLKATDTRQMLSALKQYRYHLAIEDEDYECNIPLSRMTPGSVQLEYRYSQAEIKAELATRPHVPNKREARGLRLQKIRAGV